MSKSIQTIPGKAYTISFSKPGNVIATGPEGQSLTLLSVNCAQQASFIAISRDSILSDDAAVVLPVLGASNSSSSFTVDQSNALFWLESNRCALNNLLNAETPDPLTPQQRCDLSWLRDSRSCISDTLFDLHDNTSTSARFFLECNYDDLKNVLSSFCTGTFGKGDKGCKGCKGAKGCTGAKGCKGCKGAKGCTGAKGCKGCKGAKGCKGDPGSAGGSLDLCAETTSGSTRFGNGTHTNGSTDTAIGPSAFSDASSAISIGNTSHVCGSGQGGIAIGWQARVMGVGSIAIGQFSRTCSCRSLAIGPDAHALAYDASAIGRLAENRLDRTLLLTAGGGSSGQLDVYLIAANSDISNCSILNGCAGIAWKTAHASGIKKLSELIGTNGFLTCL